MTSTRGISIFPLWLEFQGSIVLIVAPKFMWLPHSEVKRTETLEFGAGKVLLPEPSKDYGWLMLKRPELSRGFQWRVFKGKFCQEGYRVWDLPLIGWWWGNRVSLGIWHRPSRIYVLVLSLKLPSSTWIGALAPIEELSNMFQTLCSSPQEEHGLYFMAALLFLDCFFFVSGFPHVLN